MKKIATIFVIIGSTFNLFASHIIGGEMTYECLGNDSFKITLTLYQNCSESGWAEFDGPPMLAIFDLDTNERISFSLMSIIETDLDTLDLSVPCQEIPPGVCIHAQTFSQIKVLPPNENGYIASYQKCCFATEVLNIQNSDETGINLYVNITNRAMTLCNDSPTFADLPSGFLCVGVPFAFNQSGIDLENDSLSYSTSIPFDGPNAFNNPTGNVPVPPPYGFVNLTIGYSIENMLGLTSTFSVDTITGIVEGIPANIGLFTIGITISEYRDEELLSEVSRIFVYSVGNCIPAVTADFLIDTLCDGLSLDLSNNSQNSSTTYWNIEENTIEEENIIYNFQDTGSYEIILVAIAENGCTDTLKENIELYYPCGFDIKTNTIPINTNFDNLCPGEIGQIDVPYCEGYVYNWYQNSSLEVIAENTAIISPHETTTYIIDILSEDNCLWTSEIMVAVTENCEKPLVSVPNVFSPNNDGLNDSFRVLSDFNLMDFELRIFSRWGELIYTTNILNNGWDGNYKGVELPSDVYVWQLAYSYYQNSKRIEKLQSGDVFLLR